MCLQWGFGGAALLVSVAVYGVALVLNGVRTITLWQRYPKVAARAAA